MKEIFEFNDKQIGNEYHFELKVNLDLFDPWENTDPHTYIRNQYGLGVKIDLVSVYTEGNIRYYKGFWNKKTQ
jgi:hypothetical protein